MRSVFVSMLAVSLVGCDQAKAPTPPRTVLYFLEHPAELDETWARCRNDPGGIGDTPDCRNAGNAKERIMMVGREHAIEVLKR